MVTTSEMVGIAATVGALCFACALALFKYFLPAYLGEKGKNLATKEDIAGITHEVERIRLQYAELAEAVKARNLMRLAGIDRRLAAHQESFGLWRRLFAAMHGPDASKVALECQAWWEQNCLYLEPVVRSAFANAFSAGHQHADLLANRSDVDHVKENWKSITDYPNVLFPAVQLPQLSELEKTVGLPDSSSAGT